MRIIALALSLALSQGIVFPANIPIEFVNLFTDIDAKLKLKDEIAKNYNLLSSLERIHTPLKRITQNPSPQTTTGVNGQIIFTLYKFTSILQEELRNSLHAQTKHLDRQLNIDSYLDRFSHIFNRNFSKEEPFLPTLRSSLEAKYLNSNIDADWILITADDFYLQSMGLNLFLGKYPVSLEKAEPLNLSIDDQYEIFKQASTNCTNMYNEYNNRLSKIVHREPLELFTKSLFHFMALLDAFEALEKLSFPLSSPHFTPVEKEMYSLLGEILNTVKTSFRLEGIKESIDRIRQTALLSPVSFRRWDEFISLHPSVKGLHSIQGIIVSINYNLQVLKSLFASYKPDIMLWREAYSIVADLKRRFRNTSDICQMYPSVKKAIEVGRKLSAADKSFSPNSQEKEQVDLPPLDRFGYYLFRGGERLTEHLLWHEARGSLYELLKASSALSQKVDVILQPLVNYVNERVFVVGISSDETASLLKDEEEWRSNLQPSSLFGKAHYPGFIVKVISDQEPHQKKAAVKLNAHNDEPKLYSFQKVLEYMYAAYKDDSGDRERYEKHNLSVIMKLLAEANDTNGVFYHITSFLKDRKAPSLTSIAPVIRAKESPKEQKNSFDDLPDKEDEKVLDSNYFFPNQIWNSESNSPLIGNKPKTNSSIDNFPSYKFPPLFDHPQSRPSYSQSNSSVAEEVKRDASSSFSKENNDRSVNSDIHRIMDELPTKPSSRQNMFSLNVNDPDAMFGQLSGYFSKIIGENRKDDDFFTDVQAAFSMDKVTNSRPAEHMQPDLNSKPSVSMPPGLSYVLPELNVEAKQIVDKPSSIYDSSIILREEYGDSNNKFPGNNSHNALEIVNEEELSIDNKKREDYEDASAEKEALKKKKKNKKNKKKKDQDLKKLMSDHSESLKIQSPRNIVLNQAPTSNKKDVNSKEELKNIENPQDYRVYQQSVNNQQNLSTDVSYKYTAPNYNGGYGSKNDSDRHHLHYYGKTHSNNSYNEDRLPFPKNNKKNQSFHSSQQMNNSSNSNGNVNKYYPGNDGNTKKQEQPLKAEFGVPVRPRPEFRGNDVLIKRISPLHNQSSDKPSAVDSFSNISNQFNERWGGSSTGNGYKTNHSVDFIFRVKEGNQTEDKNKGKTYKSKKGSKW